MTKDWEKSLGFIDKPKYEAHVVAGKELNFYAVSYGVMVELREVIKHFGAMMANLLADTKTDTGTKMLRIPDKDVPGEFTTETTVQPINTDLAKFRYTENVKAVMSLIDALTDKKNVDIIGKVVIDSLRDIFPRGDRDNPTPGDFMAKIDFPDVVQLLIGVAKANKGVFSPLGARAKALVGAVQESVESVVKDRISILGSNSRTTGSGAPPTAEEQSPSTTSEPSTSQPSGEPTTP